MMATKPSAFGSDGGAAADAVREEFRRFLRSTGALLSLEHALIELFEATPRPASATLFLSDALAGGSPGEVTRLRAEVARLAAEVDALRAQLKRQQP